MGLPLTRDHHAGYLKKGRDGGNSSKNEKLNHHILNRITKHLDCFLRVCRPRSYGEGVDEVSEKYGEEGHGDPMTY